jgi:hypothetical protein
MSNLLLVAEKWPGRAFRLERVRHRYAVRYTLRLGRWGVSLFRTPEPGRFECYRQAMAH